MLIIVRTMNFIFQIVGILFLADVDQDIFVKKCLEPVVLIDNEAAQASGTGFIVKSSKIKEIDGYFNLVFSCQHIIKSPKARIKKAIYDENAIHKNYENYQGFLYSTDNINDLSILFFISKKQMPTVDINFDFKPKMRDKLFMVGHGLAEPARYAEGKFTGMSNDESHEANQNYRTSIPIIFGDSGCPLFYEHKVVGIGVSLRSAQYNESKFPVYDISFFKPVQNMVKLLNNSKMPFDDFNENKFPSLIANYAWTDDIKIIED